MARIDDIKKANADKLSQRSYVLIEHVGNPDRDHLQRLHPDGDPLYQVVRLQNVKGKLELPTAYQEMGWRIVEEKKAQSTRTKAREKK